MAIDFTACFKRMLCCLIKHPKRDITYAWLVSLVLVFSVFIIACVAASKLTGAKATAAAFAAVWTALLLIALSIVGTIIMRRYQSAVSIGYLLGNIFVMTQQMLIIFAIFVERSRLPASDIETPTVRSAQQAMAVFAFFLFLIYAAFGSMLAVFRDDIIKEELPMSDSAYDSSAGREEGGQVNSGGQYGGDYDDNQY
eukprot:gene4523-6388_t